jgi:hypothetical protein
MPGKRFWGWTVLAASLTSTGCCSFCDRWCGQRYNQSCAPVCCQPVCCQPCGPANYPPAPAANGSWTAPAAARGPCN